MSRRALVTYRIPEPHDMASSTRRITAPLLIAAALLTANAPAASAHPLGPPPEVTVEAAGHQVETTWRAERDDLYAIALSVGAVAGEMIFEEVNGEVVQVGGQRDDEVLAQDPAIPAYFTRTLTVAQNGQVCPAEMTTRPTYDGGAGRVVHTCPDLINVVDVTITTLTELNDAYRTIVRADGDPSTGFHDAERPTSTYTFTPTPGTFGGADADGTGRAGVAGAASAGQTTLVVATLAVLGLGGAVLVRRSTGRGSADA